MTRTWFVTGTSRGLGRAFAVAALRRGDTVAATVRTLTDLDDLVAEYGDAVLPLVLDVADRAAVFAAVDRAVTTFGRLDVVVNNAGYGHFGAVEELTEAELRRQVDVNLLGPVWVVQAAIPHLRRQHGGHVVQISSVGGALAFPTIGAYHATKWGLEGISESLAAELAPDGVRVTIVEPGAFATDWAGPSAVRSAEAAAYADHRAGVAGYFAALTPGDPAAAAEALCALVDAEDPPLRVAFGTAALELIEHDAGRRGVERERWRHLTASVDPA